MINSRDIKDLIPEAQIECNTFIRKCTEAGLNIKIIQTLRDAEYQQFLYAQGRTAPGKIVTRCNGTTKPSPHQGGRAWDAVILDDDGTINWTDAVLYKKMADIAVGMGLTAGYYFSFRDMDHIQLK